MSKRHWVFCTSCGKSYQTTNLRTQFCSKKCQDDWINCKNDTHISKSRGYGQKDKPEYKKWRKYVYEIFNKECAVCIDNTKLQHAHHIIRWVDNLELRYDKLNGILLCRDCHSIIHGYTIGSSTELFKDKEKIINVRKKYIKIAKIKYKER